MVIDDHINLTGQQSAGRRQRRTLRRRGFPDMTEVYSPRLRAIADEAARRIGHGAAARRLRRRCSGRATRRRRRSAICGRSAPTRSACRRCRKRSSRGTWAIEVLGISCITNMAAGVLPQPLDHDEVMETARRVRGQFIALLEGIVGRL